MASSSSLSCNSKYDVFLSFRGEDVRKGFLSHVMKELKGKGILPFLDNEMKRGESVGPVLVGAIRQSKVFVVLLSPKYASSSWCLDELVEIMNYREENHQTVMTIFYEVDPSDVRKQTGYFGKAFDETCVGKTEEVKQAWRQALKDVADIAGYHSSNCGNEAEMINKVASDITAVLGFTQSRDFVDFVGMGARIMEIKSKLILQSEEVKVIVLVGPAGIGKTTTARVLYNQLSPGFPFNTFLENIRGSYEKSCGNDYQLKLRLHKNLLSQIFNQTVIEVSHLGVAEQKLRDKKVLVVLDEVDSWWQLEEMANKRGWFGPGSMIIITTEDRNLLNKLKLGIYPIIYEMKFPTKNESLKIFCQYAFDKKYPDFGFEELSREVTELAGDLPLGLRVMGSYLRRMSWNEWIDALPRLRSSLDREIESTLRFSYDALNDKDKALFLHISCFFVNFKVDRIKRILEKSGLEVNHGLQVLADKSLISTERGWVTMHSLLQKLGREIVEKQSLEKPGQFLWDTMEISEVLEESTGNRNVLGILWHTSERGMIKISKSAFEGMNNLRFLKVNSSILGVSPDNLCTPEGLNCLPDKLRLIDWNRCPLRFWPSKFSAKFLVELIMKYSNFETLWEGIQPLQCLKLMDLSSSFNLKEIPDLSNATSLEKLDLDNCRSLLELTSSIGNATKLTICNLDSCRRLKELPSSMARLINLEKLTLSRSHLRLFCSCSNLEILSGCSSLKELELAYTWIKEVPSSMSTWSCLYKLDMSNCGNLKEFPNVPDSIVELDLCETAIKEIPPWIEKLFSLRKLIMHGCKKLKKISRNISKLENLEFLDLRNRCVMPHEDKVCINPWYNEFEAIIEWGPDMKCSWKLLSDFDVHYIFPICLPEKALTSPLSLRFRSNGFETIPDCIEPLSKLSKLDIRKCRNLVALPPLPGSLQSIDSCESLKRIDSSFQNPNICLNFAYCYNLDQEARNFIETSACKYAVLPGEKVPAHFTHRASCASLTINLTPTPLPSSFRFKACVLLSKYNSFTNPLTVSGLSCRVRGKQNGHTFQYVSDELYVRNVGLYEKHLYIFEDSFSLNHDCLEAGETTFSELSFVFIVHDKDLKVRGCGVRLLEVPYCIHDINVDDDDDDDDDGDKDESDDDNDGDEDESDEISDCLSLNQKAKNLILDCEYALLPGEEVPAHFTHQAISGSLTINMNPRSLPSSFRFKACILLSRDYDADNDDDEEDDNILMSVSCSFKGELNGLTVSYGSKQHEMPYIYGYEDRLYTFEDSFSLNHDSLEAEEAIFSNLMFQFEVLHQQWSVKGCGVQLLEEAPHCFMDEKKTGDEEDSGSAEDADDDEGGEDEENADDDDDEYLVVVMVKVLRVMMVKLVMMIMMMVFRRIQRML